MPIGVSIFFEAAYLVASIVISPLGAIAGLAPSGYGVTSQLFMIPMSVAMALTIMVSIVMGEKLVGLTTGSAYWTDMDSVHCLMQYAWHLAI